MNIDILRQSPDFQAFMAVVKEMGQEASVQNKTESDTTKIFRNQGRQSMADDINDLLYQIEAEQKAEAEE